MTDAVVLLHGWPGTREDYARVTPLLEDLSVPVIAPDLLGFGEAYLGPVDDADATAEAHAARVMAVVDAGDYDRVVIAGYDIGSRVAQAIARAAPERVAGLVLTPGFPSLAPLVVDPAMARHYWYQHLHRLPLAAALIDGQRDAVAAYLTHIWATWSGDPTLASVDALAATVDAYARPGAFTASLSWYRANVGYAAEVPCVTVPTIVLWGTEDPLFPSAWAEAVDASFTDVVDTRILDGVGHFVPLEAPDAVAAAVRSFLR